MVDHANLDSMEYNNGGVYYKECTAFKHWSLADLLDIYLTKNRENSEYVILIIIIFSRFRGFWGPLTCSKTYEILHTPHGRGGVAL